jgi:hypothetical protein
MVTVVDGLKQLGHYVLESPVTQRADVTNIVFDFYQNPSNVPKGSIVYQMEPVSPFTIGTGHVPIASFVGHTVWDYSQHNVRELKKCGVSALYVPIGYSPRMVNIVSSSQDIDILFYGNNTPARRKKVISWLKSREGMRVVTVCEVYGEERDALIARSKVVLNMHGEDEYRTFETARVSYLLANSKAVVSELNEGDDDDGFSGSVRMATYFDLGEACISLVEDANERIALERRGFEYMSQRDEVPILAAALEETHGRH